MPGRAAPGKVAVVQEQNLNIRQDCLDAMLAITSRFGAHVEQPWPVVQALLSEVESRSSGSRGSSSGHLKRALACIRAPLRNDVSEFSVLNLMLLAAHAFPKAAICHDSACGGHNVPDLKSSGSLSISCAAAAAVVGDSVSSLYIYFQRIQLSGGEHVAKNFETGCVRHLCAGSISSDVFRMQDPTCRNASDEAYVHCVSSETREHVVIVVYCD
jgi:hypothetical protein